MAYVLVKTCRSMKKSMITVGLLIGVVLSILGTVHLLSYNNNENDYQKQDSFAQLSHKKEITSSEAALHQLVNTYCHASLYGGVVGEEGELPHNKQGRFELVHVNMLLRHGDRSPQISLNIQPTVEYECGMVDKDELWTGLNDFQIQPLPRLAKLTNSNKMLFVGYDSLPCKVGQLTYRGFKQHRSIGSYMATKYKSLLDQSIDESFIYFQSSDYRRTIHSAAAFGLGFLPRKTSIRKSIPIYVSSPGDLLIEPPPGIAKIYPFCSNLDKILKSNLSKTNYEAEAKKWHKPFATIVDILGIKMPFSVVKLYDYFYCRMCHNISLPCGKTSCINSTLAYQAALSAHWYFSKKFTNTTAILSLQPFLFHTVIAKLDSAIKSMPSKESYHRFVVSFSHDTTVTPFLWLLGFSQVTWVPYASRVVIELWRDTTKPSQVPESYYVRFLFNGASLMAGIKHPAEDFTADRELLNYVAWKQGLMKERLRNVESYSKICLTKAKQGFLV